MLINGQPAPEGIIEIEKQLAALPSSFPDYISNLVPKTVTLEEQIARNHAIDLYHKGLAAFSEGDSRKALEQLQAVEQIPAAQTDSNLLLNVNLMAARTYQKLGVLDKAEQEYQSSIDNSLEVKQYHIAENTYKELANLHWQQGTIEKYKAEQENSLLFCQKSGNQQEELKVRLALGGVNRIQGNHDSAIDQYSAAYSLQQGKVDYEAVRVEQHEVGFSSYEKIGTDNIQQCVAVILHDPISKKTALAHFDRVTDPQSLSKDVISKFPPDTKLEAYLVGGRDRSPMSLAISDANIKKVTEELNKHASINIKSADIGDKGAPSGIVFDPQTAKLEHAVPGKEDNTTAIRQVLIWNPDPDLIFAFDLTASKEIPAPILAKEQQKELIQKYYYNVEIAPANTEVWQSHNISNPLTKAAEEIRSNDPKLVEEVFKESMEQNIKGLNFKADKKEKLKNTLFDRTTELLSDRTKPMSVARSEIRRIFYENPPEKTVFNRIKESLQLLDRIITQFVTNIQNKVKIFVSSFAKGSTELDTKKQLKIKSQLYKFIGE